MGWTEFRVPVYGDMDKLSFGDNLPSSNQTFSSLPLSKGPSGSHSLKMGPCSCSRKFTLGAEDLVGMGMRKWTHTSFLLLNDERLPLYICMYKVYYENMPSRYRNPSFFLFIPGRLVLGTSASWPGLALIPPDPMMSGERRCRTRL
jgi:hypothetical protein